MLTYDEKISCETGNFLNFLNINFWQFTIVDEKFIIVKLLPLQSKNKVLKCAVDLIFSHTPVAGIH